MTDVCTTVENCVSCLKLRKNHAEPLIPSMLPPRPWHTLGMDLFQWRGYDYIVVQDYFSRFIEAVKLRTTTTSAVILFLERLFSRHGIPERLICDCGRQLISREMFTYANKMGFSIRSSSPEFHQSNGLAEKAVATVKRILETNSSLEEGLLEYRATPLKEGWSPAQLLYGRNIRSLMPCLSEKLQPCWPDLKRYRESYNERKSKQAVSFNKRHRASPLSQLVVGDRVWVTDLNRWGTVTRKLKEDRSYTVRTEKGAIRRNRVYLTPCNTTGVFENDLEVPISQRESPSAQSNSGDKQQHTRVETTESRPRMRSGRQVRPPQRFVDQF